MKELVLQDIILNQVRRDKSTIQVKLQSLEVIIGTIRGFDSETIIMDTEKGQVMIYKSSVLFLTTPEPVLKDQPAS